MHSQTPPSPRSKKPTQADQVSHPLDKPLSNRQLAMLRRYTPLRPGKKSLQSSGSLKRTGRLSAKRKSPSPVLQAREDAYRQAKVELLAEVAQRQGVDVTCVHCEVPGCTRGWDDYHHTHGRHGTDLYDKTRLRLVCRRCHDKIHADPAWARSIGFLKPKA